MRVPRFSDKPIVRETPQNRNAHLGDDADGSAVEMVIVDAVASGLIRFHAGEGQRRAASSARNGWGSLASSHSATTRRFAGR